MMAPVLLALLLAIAAAHAQLPPLAVTVLSAEPVPALSLLELAVLADEAQWGALNPFNASQVDVTAVFAAPGGGAPFQVQGFFFQDFDYAVQTAPNGTVVGETLTPRGPPHFRVRFSPLVQGEWSVKVALSVEGGGAPNVSAPLVVVVGSPVQGERGFVRAATATHFATEQGASLFLVGENLCWSVSQSPLNDMRTWMTRLADAGANYLRLWLQAVGPFQVETLASGLGRYDLEALFRVDTVLQWAEALGMYALLAVDSYNEFCTASSMYPMWQLNPYNAANGGFLSEPFDFFSSPRAEQQWRQRAQYLVARFGFSTHVLAWELFNEVDLCDEVTTSNATLAVVATWHARQAAFLKQCDVNGPHMVTTSTSWSDGYAALLSVPELDYTQTHSYGATDVAPAVNAFVWSKALAYGKPSLVGEGLLTLQETAYDPLGLSLHNGLWASLASAAAGSAMTWWWDLYVDTQNLYPLFTPVAAVAEQIDWAQRSWTPLLAGINDTATPQPANASGPFLAQLSPLRVVASLGECLQASGCVFGPTIALAWAQNTNNTWLNRATNVTLTSIPPTPVALSGLASGTYRVAFVDTRSGTTFAQSTATAGDDGAVSFVLPTLLTDMFITVIPSAARSWQ